MLKLATKFKPDPSAFETACQAGFQFAELWLGPEILADWQNIADLARRFPLRYALHFPNRLNLTTESLHSTAKLYEALNCNCCVIHQPMFDRYGPALLSRVPPLQLAVENHKLSSEALEAWAAQNPGLTLDVEHVWKFTLADGPRERLLTTVGDLLDRFGDKIRHVHLPGYAPGFAEHRPMYCSREMVFSVLSLLADHHFAGLVVSEADPEYQNVKELHMDVLLFNTWHEDQA